MKITDNTKQRFNNVIVGLMNSQTCSHVSGLLLHNSHVVNVYIISHTFYNEILT